MPEPVTPVKAFPPKLNTANTDSEYHPALLHPYIPVTPPGNGTSNGTSNGNGASPNHHDTSPSSSLRDKHGHHRASTTSFGSGSGRKKVGFFDKVRGEAKVIVGKIEHKKDKVEAGRRILHGED